MDLSQPGSDLLGGAEAQVLRTLARMNQPTSGREVARMSGVNPSSTRRSLDRLRQTGLIRATSMKHAVLLTLNRDHVLWAPVLAMLTATETVRQEIAERATARVGDRATVAMFGSVARGDSSADSDVDVAVVFHDDVPAEEQDALTDELTLLIERTTGNPAQIFSVGSEQLQAMVAADDPLVASWRRDAQTISGPKLAALLEAS